MGNKKIFAVILAATLTTTALASPSTPLEITASAASTSAENDFLQYPVPERVIYYNPGNVMRGEDVKFVQAAINHILGTDYNVDGVAGPQTDEEIRAYQRYAGLEEDSMAGPNTIASIKKELLENVSFASGYNEDYVIDIKNNSSCNNSPVWIYRENGSDAQIFDIVYMSDGYYSIVQSSTDKVLDVAGGVTYATYVNLYEYNGTDAQLWKFIPTSETGKYMIKSKLGLYLTVTAIGGSLDNTRLCTYERQERLNAAQTFTLKKNGSSVSYSSSDIKLDIDIDKLKEIGMQSVSGPCGCYALAYSNLAENGTAKSWKNFSTGYSNQLGRYSYCADWSQLSYRHHYRQSQSTIWKYCYENLLEGKPTIINVKSGRSSGDHYVTIVGCQNVTDPTKLSGNNFLILDPAPHSKYGIENFGSVGYRLRADGDGDFDAIF